MNDERFPFQPYNALLLSIAANVVMGIYVWDHFAPQQMSLNVPSQSSQQLSQSTMMKSHIHDTPVALAAEKPPRVVKEHNSEKTNGSKQAKADVYQRNKRFVAALRRIKLSDMRITDGMLAAVRAGEFKINESLHPMNPEYTPFIAALMLDKTITLEDIQSFINEGAEIRSNTSFFLALANYRGDDVSDVVNLFATEGFDLDTQAWNMSLIERASSRGNIKLVKVLEGLGYSISDTNSFSDNN